MNTLKILSKAVCQSCGKPIFKDAEKGTEKDGLLSEFYCRKCYQFGLFTDSLMTADAMSEQVLRQMEEMKFPRFLAKLFAKKVYTLKRWEAAKAV